jgi:hypothetical protein
MVLETTVTNGSSKLQSYRLDNLKHVRYNPHMIEKIQSALTPDLLKPRFRGNANPLYGHCYAATEALYHLWGKERGYRPYRAKDSAGVTHWWLEKDGAVVDPTAGQYAEGEAPYAKGVCGGFLTRGPSRRARTIMERVK